MYRFFVQTVGKSPGPNLLNNQAVTWAEQVFVSDITDVESEKGVHYLSSVAESIEAYNCLRKHLSLGRKTPEEVHKKTSCLRQLASLKPVHVF